MRRIVSLVIAFFVLVGSSFAVAPEVSNVRASQRADGSHLVNIFYDLTDPDSQSISISVMVSENDGLSFTIKPQFLSGDAGAGIAAGNNKHIIWDSGADLPGAFGTRYRVAVIADDLTKNVWQKVSDTGPSPRRGHTMVYHDARGKVVLFGGNNGSNFKETWEWDGTKWTNVTSKDSPPESCYHAMAYDKKRGKIVLFMNGETWEWDGSSWIQLKLTHSPPARVHSVLVYNNKIELLAKLLNREEFRRGSSIWEGNKIPFQGHCR